MESRRSGSQVCEWGRVGTNRWSNESRQVRQARSHNHPGPGCSQTLVSSPRASPGGCDPGRRNLGTLGSDGTGGCASVAPPESYVCAANVLLLSDKFLCRCLKNKSYE